MAMTPYTGEVETIAKIGTTPQERAMETAAFKAAFSKDLKAFVTWFNATHKTEFDAHTAETAAKHITESGSNENGSYIKFDDGTMICWSNNALFETVAVTTGIGGLYRSGGLAATYPVAFIGAPGVSGSIRYSSSGFPWFIRPDTADNSSTTYKFCLMSAESITIATLNIKFIAVGRWKA